METVEIVWNIQGLYRDYRVYIGVVNEGDMFCRDQGLGFRAKSFGSLRDSIVRTGGNVGDVGVLEVL